MSLDLFSLQGQVALVTGANTGLGQGIAVALAGAGADIVAAGRSSASDTRRAVEALGRRFHEVKADLSSTAPIESLVEEGFERSLLEGVIADLRVLEVDPGRRDVAWRLGLDKQVVDPVLRTAEFGNWLRAKVLPRRAERLAAADVVLAPCAVESFGLAVLEALACGTPVVAPATGAVATTAAPRSSSARLATSGWRVTAPWSAVRWCAS